MGNKYESEMRGEKPTSKLKKINYESDMRGEKPVRAAMNKGGQVKGYAAGGAAKIRHGVATAAGKPINRKLDKSK